MFGSDLAKNTSSRKITQTNLLSRRVNDFTDCTDKSEHITYLHTYSMEQSPSWKAIWFLQLVNKFPAFLETEVPHRTQKRPPHVPILSQLHPVPTTPSHFPKIHLNIILLSTSGSPQWSLSLRFPNQNPVHTSPLPHTRHMPCPSHSEVIFRKVMLRFML